MALSRRAPNSVRLVPLWWELTTGIILAFVLNLFLALPNGDLLYFAARLC